MGCFYGIGVGPGKSGLLTLEGYQILQQVQVVIVPVKKVGSHSLAFEIVKPFISTDKTVVEQLYPMSYDQWRLNQAWQANQQEISSYLDEGLDVAFLTLGDPFVYSTYSYIYQFLTKKGYPGTTISGITSFQAASALAGRPLVQGEERLAILSGTDNLDELEQILELFDTVVILKVNRIFAKVYQLLAVKDWLKSSYLVSSVGMLEEQVYSDLSVLAVDEKFPYLTTLIIHKGSDRR